MNAVVDAYRSESGGEAIQKDLAPIKNRWNGQMRQAVLSKDKAKREELEQFRADVISYRNAWQFLSQIVPGSRKISRVIALVCDTPLTL